VGIQCIAAAISVAKFSDSLPLKLQPTEIGQQIVKSKFGHQSICSSKEKVSVLVTKARA
jgi:hypothetical protein